jgi:hypothetical protein
MTVNWTSLINQIKTGDTIIGDRIKIINMEGEPHYKDREGVVTHIDDAGQIHGTWGGCAIVPEADTYIVLPNIEK